MKVSEEKTGKKKIALIAGIIAVLAVGGAGTVYLTQPADEPPEIVECQQVQDDNPWKVLETIKRQNTTDSGVSAFSHAESERVRISWESNRPINVSIVWDGGWNPGPLVWSHTATSADEIVEFNLTADGKLHLSGIVYFANGDSMLLTEDEYLRGGPALRIEHVNLTAQGVTYELKIEIPKEWKDVLVCKGDEIHADDVLLQNNTFSAGEKIRITWSNSNEMAVQIRRSVDDSLVWEGSGTSGIAWYDVDLGDQGQEFYASVSSAFGEKGDWFRLTIEIPMQ